MLATDTGTAYSSLHGSRHGVGGRDKMSTAQNMIDLNATDLKIQKEAICYEMLALNLTRAEFADGSAMDKVDGDWILEEAE